METTFEIPSTDKHPFVAPLKSHGSFSLRARLSDVGKTQLPICRGCAVFANAKQRLKMRPHKLEDGLTDLLSGTSTDGFSFFFFSLSCGVCFCNWAANYETSVIIGEQYTHV